MTIRFTNVAAFNKDLDRFQKKTGKAPGTIARLLAGSIFKGVVERTPVDTGWARANWQWAEGALPRDNPVPKPAENNVLPEPRVNVAPATTTRFPLYWVVNNIPYIIYLEQGRSKQMGKGYMVQRTLVAVRSEIKKILREISR